MYMDVEKLKRVYAGTDLEETANMIADTDLFHALIPGSKASVMTAASVLRNPPKDYLKWVMVCKGGLLYDIRMLSKTGDDNDVAYGSFAEYGEMARDAGVPDGYPVFAALDTGDFLCFHYDDAANACGPKVYQWDGEDSAFVLEWESFDAWLSEQVCTAMEMIAEGELEPVPFKAEEEG